MKLKILSLALTAVAMLASGEAGAKTMCRPAKFMVISDTHLLAPSLVDEGSAAARTMAQNDMKLPLASLDILDAMLDSVRRTAPDALLIAGDLTFNGERESHELLAARLAALQRDGIAVRVIPGNHDINNPYAKAFRADGTKAVPTIDADEFAALYAHCGYDGATSRDKASLSYATELVPGIVLLAIDSNRYGENRSDSVTVYRNGGHVKSETLEWLRKQIHAAKGKRVIAMMHHHLLEHIDGEQRILPNYIVDNSDEVIAALEGVPVVFTGHLHITDAVTHRGIVDVTTGSTCTYPFPLRTATVDSSGTLTIATSFLADSGDRAWTEQGRRQVTTGATAVAKRMTDKMWSRIDGLRQRMAPMLMMLGVDIGKLPMDASQLTTLIATHMSEPLTQSLLTVTRGGEDPQQGEAIAEAMREAMTTMLADIVGEGGAELLVEALMPRLEPTMRSALLDLNHVDTPDESHTPDHRLTIPEQNQ